MHLGKSWWTAITSWLTLSPFGSDDGGPQISIGISHDLGQAGVTAGRKHPPVFKPPGGGIDDDFVCKYPAMTGWVPCSTPDDRECWLRHEDGREFNIHTNYEKYAPVGIVRNYTIIITDKDINADGQWFKAGKAFNETFPGPWIQACWGDQVRVTIINKMKWNGTSIHWHGIRQNQTMHMDGVNGVTQCPIAPGDKFEYVFNTTQYGSTWYHSHYSVQYADGLQGPITIHGPHSAPFDEPKRPLIMTDWNHVGGFEFLSNLIHNQQNINEKNKNTTILLNGAGDVERFGYEQTVDPPGRYELHFKVQDVTIPGRAKRYLLRLINTSFDSTFIFSIDNHWLQIIGADFVPIEPYYNTSVLVGIGQRYHVIVEANPQGGPTNPLPTDGNFWIRTWVADHCSKVTHGGLAGYERTGVIRYNPLATGDPVTQPWNNIALRCSDETYSSLKPKLPWTVGKPKNTEAGTVAGEKFDIKNSGNFSTVDGFPLAFFSLQRKTDLGFRPLQINYSDPSFLHLEFKGKWNSSWLMIPENYGDEDWVYLVLTGAGSKSTFGAHPIHLHGHDFAILQQEEDLDFGEKTFRPKLDNPPRRDVVLLPNNGFVVIAFKTDNPGLWLMHCHIAFHASFGLGLQINERQDDANKRWPFHADDAIAAANKTCDNWHTWVKNCTNLWPGVDKSGQNPACKEHRGPTNHTIPFQDDSGV